MRWLPRSLLGRVWALYAATLTVVACCALGLVLWQQEQRQVADTRDDAQALLALVVPMLTDSAVIGDYDAIRRQLELLTRHTSIDVAIFRDPAGTLMRVEGAGVASWAPGWLAEWVRAQLGRPSMAMTAGGRAYGDVQLTLSAPTIAGQLWQQALWAVALAFAGVLAGLLVIRHPLSRWLAPMERIGDLDPALRGGRELAQDAMRADAPVEFHRTFEVLDRAAATMQEQRERAAATLQAIDDAVLSCDAGGRVLLANDAAQRLFARPLARLAGETLPALLPALAALPLAAGARWQHRRLDWTDESGQAHVLDANLSPVLDAQGASGGLVLACRDITEQARVEEAMRALNAARDAALASLRHVLEDSAGHGQPAGADAPLGDLEVVSMLVSRLVSRLHEHGEQLDAIFALSPDGFVSFDNERRVRYASPGFARLTGLSAEMVLGLEEPVFLHRLRSRVADPTEMARLEPLFAGRGSERRVMLNLARPARRVLQAALHAGGAQVVARVLHLRDVTRETEVERMKSEFVAAAAHELRTPMVGIYGYSELLVTRQLPPERAQPLLQRIHRQCEVMVDILNEMLDLARMEARQGSDFQIVPTSLAEVVRTALADWCPPPDRAAPRLAGAELPTPVRADGAKLQRALRNLLSNAYKYSPQGGEVDLQLLRDQARARCGIAVQDHGIGMTPEQLARVGERFWRADASGTVLGTGLGMSLVREIVSLHDGQLELTSEPGHGTRAVLWLPMAEVTDDADEAVVA